VLAANLIDALLATHISQHHPRTDEPGRTSGADLPIPGWRNTPKKRSAGGYREAGEPVWSLDGLKAALAPHFRLLGEPRDVPFVIRETRRKFQHTVAELTVWELK